MKDYLEVLVKPLLSKPEEMKIEETQDQMGVLFSVTIDKDDMGGVIGRSGETAKAIRHIFHIVGLRNKARVSIKFVEPVGGKYFNK